MGLIRSIAGRLGYVPRQQARGFNAALLSRLTNDMPTSDTAIDYDIRTGLTAVRARARHLTKNNDYAKKYIRLLKTNVTGPNGFKLSVNARDRSGARDREASRIVEMGWKDFSRPEHCSISQRHTLRAIQELLVVHAGRDGEAILRIPMDPAAKYGLRLMVVPPELLDETYNTRLDGGNVVRMGVELTPTLMPVRYYFRKVSPAVDGMAYGIVTGEREAVAANEVLHGFEQEYVNQTRGISWLVQSMIRLNMLGQYDLAAVTNARVTAAKLGFLKVSADAGDLVGDDEDSSGNTIIDADPGSINQLPPGYDFTGWDPTFPHSQHGPFVKAQLRGIAAGLGVSYNSFANDLEGVNYSSIRAGVLDEREQWKLWQTWFVESFLTPLYEKWLRMALMKGALPGLKVSDFDRLNDPTFTGRRWAWVDPEKDIDAVGKQISFGLATLSGTLAEQGDDLDEIAQTIEEDRETLEEHGIPYPFTPAMASQKADTAVSGPPEEEEPEPEEEPEESEEDEDRGSPQPALEELLNTLGKKNGNS